MADSINLNGYNASLDGSKPKYLKASGGSRINKTRFSYREVDNNESSFGIEMTHHHGGGSHGGGTGIWVFCCVSVATGAAGLRRRNQK